MVGWTVILSVPVFCRFPIRFFLIGLEPDPVVSLGLEPDPVVSLGLEPDPSQTGTGTLHQFANNAIVNHGKG